MAKKNMKGDEDIYDKEHSALEANFLVLKEIGEKVAGILVDVQERDATISSDGEEYGAQMLYTLDTKNYKHLAKLRAKEKSKIGQVVTIPVNKDKASVVIFLSKAKPGNLVGFNFKTKRTTKYDNDAHIIVPSIKVLKASSK